MSTYVDTLLSRFARKGLLIDTNLLLLHFIGSYDIGIIQKQSFKRTERFTPDDYALLQKLIRLCGGRVVTTPHVLTEVSNLAGQLPGSVKQDCFLTFQECFASFQELKQNSVELSYHSSFSYLGLTDTALAMVATEYMIVTADLRFEVELGRLGLHILNINHLREHVWR